MIQKKPSLGRGLDALLGQMSANRLQPTLSVPVGAGLKSPGSAGAPGSLLDDEFVRLPLDLLQRGRYQPRMDMRPETLEDLASSIRTQGVIQPIVVRPIETAGDPKDGIAVSVRYEIIAGERRWRAAQIAGLESIPAIIRRVPDTSAIAMALIENIQRENLNPLEEARALDRLISEFALTHQQAADAVGRSRATVSNLLRLLDLAPEVAELVDQRAIEMGHGRALLGLTQRRQQIEVAILVVKKGLSVRETEALVRRLSNPTSKDNSAGSGRGSGKDPNVQHLEAQVADILGAKVSIEHIASSGKGKVVVNYNSLDELDGILAHIR